MQQEAIYRANGATEAQIDLIRSRNAPFFAALVDAPSQAEAEIRARDLIDSGEKNHVMTPEQAAQSRQIMTPWMVSFLRYDPTDTLKALKTPLLALNGSLDLQVLPKENLEAIRALTSGLKDRQIMELQGLNHLFQAAKTGAPSEYPLIEETINPGALELISGWVVAHTK